jgi:hypothetical protein
MSQASATPTLTRSQSTPIFKNISEDSEDSDGENQYLDELSDDTPKYSNFIFFIFGYLKKHEVNFQEDEQEFVMYCYKMITHAQCDCECKCPHKTIFRYVYKQIEGAWETYLTHVHHNNLDIPKNIGTIFYDETLKDIL